MTHFPTPLFPPHVTSRAMEALNGFIVVHGHDSEPIVAGHLEPLRQRLTEMVDCFFPENGDQEEFTGADTIDGNDYIHPAKVAELAAAIGREMGMPRSRMIELAIAASLMNLGYVRLRRNTLDVARPLSTEEWEQHVRPHAAGGVVLLAEAGLSNGVMEAIGQHHERWDGSGYPLGLTGAAIAEDARIVAVADAYVSLRSYRPYRRAVDAEKALNQIALDSGTKFESSSVDLLATVVRKYKTRVEAQVAVQAGRQGLRNELHELERAAGGRSASDVRQGREERISRDRPIEYGADAPTPQTQVPQHVTIIRRPQVRALPVASERPRPSAPQAVTVAPGKPRRRRGGSSMFASAAYLDDLRRRGQ